MSGLFSSQEPLRTIDASNTVRVNHKPSIKTNVLPQTAGEYGYAPYAISFDVTETVQDLLDALEKMSDLDIHLVGSRGCVYHSHSMGMMIRSLWSQSESGTQILPPNCWRILTRSGNLRQRVIELFYGKDSEIATHLIERIC